VSTLLGYVCGVGMRPGMLCRRRTHQHGRDGRPSHDDTAGRAATRLAQHEHQL
jgi:hypothetical protein